MLCRDFEHAWNELLDGRSGALAALEREIEAHSSACAACRKLGARYQVLRQALRGWAPVPAVPPDFAERFLSRGASVGVRRSWSLPLVRVRRPAAIAASIFVVVALGWRLGPKAPVAVPEPPKAAQPIDPEALTEALATAGGATWDLARETSGPAARIGREFFESAALSGTKSSLPLQVMMPPAADVLQSVGERVHAGVRPLSGTARHAFGFLLAPSVGPTTPPPPST